MGSVEQDPNCAFCSIARGAAPDTEVVWEDEAWMAFFPLNPATPGHTLIIPRAHKADLWEVDLPLGDQLMRASIQLGRAIRSALNPDGLNLITSAGKTAEQTVFHLHLHLVPRWKNDGFGKIWPTEGSFTKDDLEVTADRIADAYKEFEHE